VSGRILSWTSAVPWLKQGGILVYPTDTVWGLGCRADCADLVAACLALKGGRPNATCSVVVDAGWLADLVFLPPGEDLKPYFPGPYTLVLPLRDGRYSHLAGPGEGPLAASLGCRVPALPALRRLVAALGVPLVTTSVNDHGSPPALLAEQARLWAARHGLAFLRSSRCGSHPSTVLAWRGGGWQQLRGPAGAAEKA